MFGSRGFGRTYFGETVRRVFAAPGFTSGYTIADALTDGLSRARAGSGARSRAVAVAAGSSVADAAASITSKPAAVAALRDQNGGLPV